jgi:hypothetical protein
MSHELDHLLQGLNRPAAASTSTGRKRSAQPAGLASPTRRTVPPPNFPASPSLSTLVSLPPAPSAPTPGSWLNELWLGEPVAAAQADQAFDMPFLDALGDISWAASGFSAGDVGGWNGIIASAL